MAKKFIMTSEKEKLQKEFEYLSNLIAKHKLSQVHNSSTSGKDAGVGDLTSSSTAIKEDQHDSVEGHSNKSVKNCLEAQQQSKASLSSVYIETTRTCSDNISIHVSTMSSSNFSPVAIPSRTAREETSTRTLTLNYVKEKSKQVNSRQVVGSPAAEERPILLKQVTKAVMNRPTKFIVHLSDLPTIQQNSKLFIEAATASHSNINDKLLEKHGRAIISSASVGSVSSTKLSSTESAISVNANAAIHAKSQDVRQHLSSGPYKGVSCLASCFELCSKVDKEKECTVQESLKVTQTRTVLLPRSEVSASVKTVARPQFACMLGNGLMNYGSLHKLHGIKSAEKLWNTYSNDVSSKNVLTDTEIKRSKDQIKQSKVCKAPNLLPGKEGDSRVDASFKATGLRITVKANALKQTGEVKEHISNLQWRPATKAPEDAGQVKVHERTQNLVTKGVPRMSTKVESFRATNNRYKFVRPDSCNVSQPQQLSRAKASMSSVSPGIKSRVKVIKDATRDKYRLVRSQNEGCHDVGNFSALPICNQSTEQPSESAAVAALSDNMQYGLVKNESRPVTSRYKLVKQVKGVQTALSCKGVNTSTSTKSTKSPQIHAYNTYTDGALVRSPLSSLRVNAVGSVMSQRFSSPGNVRQMVKGNNNSAFVLNKYKLVKCRQPVVKQQHVRTTEANAGHTVRHVKKVTHGSKATQSPYKLNRRLSSGSSSVDSSRKKSDAGLKPEEIVAKGVIRSKYKLIRRKSSRKNQVSLPGISKSLLTLQRTRRHSGFLGSMLVVNKYKLITRRSSRGSSGCNTPLSRWTQPMISQLKTSPGWNSSTRMKFNRTGVAASKQRCRRSSFVSKFALKRNTKGCDGDGYKIGRRKFNNVSRNKYKFVNSNVALKHLQRMSTKHRYPQKSQLKVDHRRSSLRRRKSGSTPLVVKKRFSLCRVSGRRVSGGNVVENYSPLLTLATQIVQRSVYKLAASQANRYKKATVDSPRYCMYYNRFGRCTRADKCTFIHDPDKVSVCTRFLRGTCKVDDCPFSHSVAPHKMPACQYFLRGICSRDNCPYLHVKVADNAEPCLDFARGYCRQGDMCKKLHVLVCPSFKTTGTCPRGRKCPMRHPKHSTTTRVENRARSCHGSAEVTGADRTDDPSRNKSLGEKSSMISKRKMSSDDDDDPSLPMKHRRMPSYIALNSSDTSEVYNPPDESNKCKDEGLNAEPLVIRPRLDKPAGDIDLSWMLNL